MTGNDSISRRTLLSSSLALAGAELISLSGAHAASANGQFFSLKAPLATPENAHAGLPFRHIHLDCHTSPAITGVGEHFNAEQFAATLQEASINSITVFAKCHHGMAYYPTKVGKQHPHLNFDLLGEMIEACHRRNIQTPVYISTMYDQHAWLLHGDWRALDENGAEQGHRTGAGPLRSTLGRLCINTPYLDYLSALAEEMLSNYDADGVFYDNYVYGKTGCCCAACISERQKLGLDSQSQDDRLKHMHLVMSRGMERLAAIARRTRPKGTCFINGVLTLSQQPQFLRSSLPFFSHVEIESLPGGSWGYSYFPMAARRLRNLGLDTRGMTGAFHRSWGDFGTVRTQAALDYECFSMLAQATMCSVGDHLHPAGQLNRETYTRIGRTYRSVAEKEPWCAGAEAVTEIGHVFSGEGADAAQSDLGVANMLTQLRQQYDIVDAASDFQRYQVLILPDVHRLDAALKLKLQGFLAKGGKLILCNQSGLDMDGKRFVLPIGAQYESSWSHDNQYLEVLNAEENGLPAMLQIAYEPGTAVRLSPGGTLVARCWDAYFDKSYLHFQVEQTPPARPTDYAAAVFTANTAYFAPPLFRNYAQFGYPFYRDLVGLALKHLLPAPLVKAEGPTTLQATVTRQPKRTIVHLLHYAPERRAPGLDIVEDTVPLAQVKVALRVGRAPNVTYLAPQKEELSAQYSNGYAETVVPIMRGHQMVVFED